MVELKLNYDELTEMSLEDAKKIIEEFNKESFLEDIGDEVGGVNYGVKILDEGNWIDKGKYQYRTDIGVLCEFDENPYPGKYIINFPSLMNILPPSEKNFLRR